MTALLDALLGERRLALTSPPLPLPGGARPRCFRAATADGPVHLKVFDEAEGARGELEGALLEQLGRAPATAPLVPRLLNDPGGAAVSAFGGARLLVTRWEDGAKRAWTAFDEDDWAALGDALGALHVELARCAAPRPLASAAARAASRDLDADRATLEAHRRAAVAPAPGAGAGGAAPPPAGPRAPHVVGPPRGHAPPAPPPPPGGAAARPRSAARPPRAAPRRGAGARAGGAGATAASPAFADAVETYFEDRRVLLDAAAPRAASLAAGAGEQAIHNDYNQHNYLFRPGAPPLVCDWERAALAPPELEVVRTLSVAAIALPARASRFVEAYRLRRPLSRAGLRFGVAAVLADHATKHWPTEAWLAGEPWATVHFEEHLGIVRTLTAGRGELERFHAEAAGRC